MVGIFLLTKVQEAQTPQQKQILEAALVGAFPDSWRDIGNGSYLVATSKSMITQDISGAAGITGGEAGSYIVTSLQPYYGWASTASRPLRRVMNTSDCLSAPPT